MLQEYCILLGVSFSKMSVTEAKTRFGSCSCRGSISFSYRLMLYPKEAIEYVVLHEACHLVFMNHSADFYKLIEKYMPDYKSRARLLK